ncbi:MAG TPA: nuclear transport factor 2 family protein [Polyangiales bacterium]|nr:nuclear transport factor 2 family protein [Polyangiales bacterium]
MNNALTIARTLYAALEAGHQGPQLRPLFHDDAYTLEHPNLIKPRGARVDSASMLRASESGAALLASQRYDVLSALEIDDTAILRLTWTGVIARELGPFREGQILTARIAQFITAREGRIASIETYDCYEPFA